MTRTLFVLVLVTVLTACGGGGGSPTAPVTPPPPTRAQVTFNLDPKVATAEYQGGGWYRFRVNMQFIETAGVGFMINSTRVTLIATPSNTVLLDTDYVMAARVDPLGQKVFQWTSPLYRSTFATPNATVKMLANITDDKGNAITVSNEMSVKNVGGEIEIRS